ncbi:MAG: hypothetical protein ABIO99_02425 [Candidatus Limnocylindria bacterium]
MNVTRLRGPLLAGITTLLIAGAGSGAVLAAGPSSAAPATDAAAEQPESTGPDTDLIESGDQSGTDAVAEAAEAEVSSADADGPGGHEDVGETVDHQFDGEE